MNMVFTGEGYPPKVVSGDAQMLKTIAQDKRAVGIISLSAVDARVRVIAKF